MSDRGTDIHFEPLEHDLRIRYRIDGLLYEAAVPPSISASRAAIISRIKIMADMNIAERRLPQDGKIKIKHGRQGLRPARLDHAHPLRRDGRRCVSSRATASS